MTCPPLIDLSQFVDAELDAAAMLRVAQHLRGCQDCGRNVTQLESITSDRARATHAGVSGPACASSETLLAYLLSPSTEHELEAHVGRCEHCAVSLQRLQRTISSIPEMSVAVPAQLRERVAGALAPAAPPATSAVLRQPFWQRMVSVLRYPVLVPTAFATGVLLYVAAQQLPLAPGLPVAGSRAVWQPGSATRRITTADAPVYAERSPRAAVLVRLARGDTVAISLQEHGWYRVLLADGREGWIEERSLQ